MALLVRKIEMGKWQPEALANGKPVSADAITGCMRTRGNTLSFWYVDEESEMDIAALAIVGICSDINTLFLMPFDVEYFENNGFTIVESEGDTPVSSLRGLHRDLSCLNLECLNKLAKQSVALICGDKVKKYSKLQLKELLKAAILQGEVKVGELPEKFQNQLLKSYPELAS